MLKNYLFLLVLCVLSFGLNAQSPLTVYTEENYGGDSQVYEIVTAHKNLGAFDNTIKSFKLQQGYMATFATSSNGTGYSRVFIAEDADLEVPVMPAYLHGTVSFIRTMTWHPSVTKRGWCGTGNPTEDLVATNSSWFYNWDTGVATTPSIEYVPMRHNLNWASFTPANTYDGYTHFLGYNEPDRPDQANMTVQQCIDNWKYFMESGLRVGSVATSDPFNGYLGNFMAAAEAQNLRVDFVAIHTYWNKSASQWSGDLDWVWNSFKRPIWITEGNKGANWTGNSFPDGPSKLTDANATHHFNNIKGIIDVLESKPYVERYSLYNWVEDGRAFIVNIDDGFRSRNPDWETYVWLQEAILDPIATWMDASGDTDYRVITPAGKYYADHASNKAYNAATEYVPTWTPIKESLTFTASEDFQSLILNWEGKNGELVNKYVVQRKAGFSWTTIYDSSDYNILSTSEPIPTQSTEYRIKVVGKDNVESISVSYFYVPQSITEAPNDLAGESISAKKINLSWSAVTNAEAYNIKRATTAGGTYQTIASYITGLNYVDSGLEPETNYYYKISSVNTGGESADSSPEVMVTTNGLVAPSAVTNILAGSGDAQVKLKWDFIPDSQFDIKRSDSEFGTFTTIATTDFDATEYTDLTAINGTTYYYKILAFNDMGDSGNSNAVVSEPGLGQHLYYNFNESTGTNPLDKWGLNSGTIMASVGWNTGKEGSGIDLTGVSTSYMSIEDGFLKDVTDFTISTWVKLDASSNWIRLFDFGTGASTNMFVTPQNGGTGKYRFAIKQNNGTEEQINSEVSPAIGTWVHVAVTLEGNVGIMYIDGVEVGRKEDFTLNPAHLGITTQNYIGKSQYPDPYLNGSVDEFRIYNRALSSTEITNLVNTTLDVEDAVLSSKSDYIFFTVDNTLNAVYHGSEKVDYRIYTINGQLVGEGKLQSKGVTNLGNFKKGIYIVRVVDGLGVQSTKVLVN